MSKKSFRKHHLAGLFLAIGLLSAVLPLIGPAQSIQAAAGSRIYISPSSQSVTTGSNVVISVIVDPGGAAINTVQSVLSYSPSNFSFVGITAGPAFTPPDGSWQGIFTYTTSSGSVQFTASPPVQTTTTNPVVPITSVQTVVTITLHATGTGTSAINFASICPAGNFALTCSAAYDNVTNTNDLIGATNPVSGGSYTVNAVATPGGKTTTPTPTPAATPTTTKSGSTSSGTAKTSSGGSPAAPATNSTAAPTPTTTTTNPAPIITNVSVSDITATNATISWQTNIPSTSAVSYGLNTKYGLVAQSDGLSTTHKVTIGSSNLTQGTTYYFVVSSASSSGASTTGDPQQFTTTGFSVTLLITDKTGKPIKGAVVTADGQTQTSDSTGLVTFKNLPAGSETIVIKSGGTSTTRTIAVGKLDPKTGTYQQRFSLTAVRGSNSTTPYVIVALLAVLAAAFTLFVPIGPLRRLAYSIGSGGRPGGMGHGSGSAPYDPSGSSTTSGTPDTDSSPIQVISPDSSTPSSTSKSTSSIPVIGSATPLGRPKNPDPGTVVTPSADKDKES